MTAKKLIEVAMPIKEISTESVRDKSIRHGHISTLHLWWARRPLPTARAITFASLVPDPLDDNCPQSFRDAVADILSGYAYKPYADIPYTAICDPMEDNLRNRLLSFIGAYSDDAQKQMINGGKAVSPANQISQFSLIKWENKNDREIIEKARKLIFVAYQSEKYPDKDFNTLSEEFDTLTKSIKFAEDDLYDTVDRHNLSSEIKTKENNLRQAIKEFLNHMPMVLDPFAGGGAIPLEAARLGCRSYGNDINPVANIIERCSAEYPQQYGKRIVMSAEAFEAKYGIEGKNLFKEKLEAKIPGYNLYNNYYIPNRLSFDVELYAKRILMMTQKEVGHLYPEDSEGRTPIAYYWARTAKCSNPSCGAEVPLLKSFYLCNTDKKHIYLNPIINGTDIQFEIKTGKYFNLKEFLKSKKCDLICPCCGSVTEGKKVKSDFVHHRTGERLLAVIKEDDKGKTYTLPSKADYEAASLKLEVERPTEMMNPNDTQNVKIHNWGFAGWGDMFSDRQIYTINHLIANYHKIVSTLEKDDYHKAMITFLAVWIDRIILINTSFGRYNVARETLEHMYSKQAIPMMFDYPESNPFCNSSGSALNHIEWLLKYFESESKSCFSASFSNASSGDKLQFLEKSIDATVTDPPYYDAIAYADLSDFFYVWLKRTLGELYPDNFSTPLTPKREECTALKHHHDGKIDVANHHFEHKLTEIFDAIEVQTNGIVAIMFAHQSTKAWTTLINSILSARMNITGSWPMDTEMTSRSLAIAGDALESSVTVACRTNERSGYGDFSKVNVAIKETVQREVKNLYDLGFRGADLLTACFGKAVSEFGHYKTVEKADGTEVSVEELLTMTREAAINELVAGVNYDDLTKFYVVWLNLNAMGDADFDDATKFTRVGLTVDIHDIFVKRILVKDADGNKIHLASAVEHMEGQNLLSFDKTKPMIYLAHQIMCLYNDENKAGILEFIAHIAPSKDDDLWRLIASLRELLPAGDDQKSVTGILQNLDMLLAESKTRNDRKPQQQTLNFE